MSGCFATKSKDRSPFPFVQVLAVSPNRPCTNTMATFAEGCVRTTHWGPDSFRDSPGSVTTLAALPDPPAFLQPGRPRASASARMAKSLRGAGALDASIQPLSLRFRGGIFLAAPCHPARHRCAASIILLRIPWNARDHIASGCCNAVSCRINAYSARECRHPPMIEAFLVSTGVVALAEIGDKTQLLAMVLAARYRRPLPIILGILVATLLNHALAGFVGAWVASAIGPVAMHWILGLSF